nr:hypothetical protein CFP56_02734 [Quercus suber]
MKCDISVYLLPAKLAPRYRIAIELTRTDEQGPRRRSRQTGTVKYTEVEEKEELMARVVEMVEGRGPTRRAPGHCWTRAPGRDRCLEGSSSLQAEMATHQLWNQGQDRGNSRLRQKYRQQDGMSCNEAPTDIPSMSRDVGAACGFPVLISAHPTPVQPLPTASSTSQHLPASPSTSDRSSSRQPADTNPAGTSLALPRAALGRRYGGTRSHARSSCDASVWTVSLSAPPIIFGRC